MRKKVLKKAFAWLLAAVLFAGTAAMNVTPAKAAADSIPAAELVHNKTLTSNENGTYKLALDTVSENAVDGYVPTVNGTDIVNTHETEKTSVAVTKVWSDRENARGLRTESVTIHLFANGVDTGKVLVLTEEMNWAGKFEELDVYTAGEKIVYTVTEDEIAEYTTKITGNAEEGFTVTNTATFLIPITPGDPENPEKPNDPGIIIPVTGESDMFGWIVTVLFCVAILGILLVYRKHEF